jgi:hypothetical protein
MQSIRHFDLSVEFEDMHLSDRNNTPDANLLFAILERAILDLFIREEDKDNQKYKTQAIRWFKSSDSLLKNGFSFLQIVQYLNISNKTASKLVELAQSVQHKKGKYYELYPRYRSRCYRGIRYTD